MTWIYRIAIICFFTISYQTSKAQYTFIGNLTYSSSTYGPMVGSIDSNNSYSRYAYTYPAASLGDLQHGDTIRALEFYKYNAGTFRGNPNVKIYLGMSDSADFGAGNIKSWAAITSLPNVQCVFNQGIGGLLTNQVGFVAFDFDTAFAVDTTYGKNLRMFVEYSQTTTQVQFQTPSWAYDSDFSYPYFVSNNETKYNVGFSNMADTTRFSQVRKPCVRLHHPRESVNASVEEVYALGELALLMAPVDTIKFNVSNFGLENFSNKGFQVRISGANTFTDTVYCDTLGLRQSRMLFSHRYKPKNQGIDTITVTPIGDKHITDDTTVFVRRISYNVISHNNPLIGNSGGVGFPDTTGDFVAKFYTDSNYINQVKIGFTSSNLEFNVLILDEDSNGLPGKELYVSDTLLSKAGMYIQPILPKVQVHGGYYVGIRQLGSINIGFQFEYEEPVRPNTFYFTGPIGNPDWTPFDPGYDFNVDIQPRIQVSNDVSVISVLNPLENDTFEFNAMDSIQPKAWVYNYGANDQNVPFAVVCEVIDQYNNQVYKSTKLVKLKSDDSLQVAFDDYFSLGNYGNLKMRVYTNASNDLASENDTIEVNFAIFVNYDIQVESFFDPQEGNRYELNKDKVAPTVRIVNFGSKDQQNIKVTSRIISGTNVANQQTKTIDIMGGGSVILSFDSVQIPFYGSATFEVFCWNQIDSFPTNDTARVNVEVVRSNDLGVSSIIRPQDSSIYERKQVFRPYINYRNYGLGDQDSIVITASIAQMNGNVIYKDTIITSLPKLSSFQALFKEFTAPDSAQTLRFFAKTWIDADQNTENDTIASYFFVRTKKDVAVTRIVQPTKDTLITVGDKLQPSMVIQNIGNSSVTNSFKAYCEFKTTSGTDVYFDSIEVTETMLKLDSLKLSFKDFIPFVKDNYNVKMYIALASDGERRNDTLYSSFRSSANYSVGIVSINKPIEGKVYQLNVDPIQPSFTIHNSGIKDILSAIKYEVDVFDASNQVVYHDENQIDSLKFNSNALLSLSEFKPTEAGDYTAVFAISNADDAIDTDNEDTVRFVVAIANDVRPIRFVFPEVDSIVYANRRYAPLGEFENIGDSVQSTNFSVTCMVEYQGSMFYNSNRSLKLAKGEKATVKFDSVFYPKTPGTYTMSLITRLSSDQVVTNDTLTNDFTVEINSSIKDLANSGVRVFPNPVVNQFTIETKEQVIQKVNVYDYSGRLVISKTPRLTNSCSIDMSEQSPAIYWVEIVTEGESIWTNVLVNNK